MDDFIAARRRRRPAAWRRPARVLAIAALAAGLLLPAGGAEALENGIGIIKIANPSNGTFASVDSNGFPAPGSGLHAAPGDVLKVKTWEIKPNARYALWFIWPAAVFSGVECRAATTETGRIMENALAPGNDLRKMRTDALGRFDRDPFTAGAQAYKALVPVGPEVGQGTAEICAREVSPFPDHTTTQHVHLTIM